MTKEEAVKEIKKLVGKTLKLIPTEYEKDLPPTEFSPNVPKWHDYEHTIWQNGEKIRQILCVHKNLRKNKELLDLFLTIALNRNAKRGRQSFIMLFWYKHCSEYADLLIKQIDDDFVNGYIIEGLNKMKVGKFFSLVEPYKTSKVTWIRNQAKKYINEYST